MATYRNKSDEDLIVGLGLRTPRTVKVDETFDVDDAAAENYDLNDNFVRVDSPSPPEAVDAPNPKGKKA